MIKHTVESLAKIVEEERTRFRFLAEERDKLAAENAYLKEYAKIDGYDKCDNCGFEAYVMTIETPTTDAYVAEIRAQAVEDALQMVKSAIASDAMDHIELLLSRKAANIRAAAKRDNHE